MAMGWVQFLLGMGTANFEFVAVFFQNLYKADSWS